MRAISTWFRLFFRNWRLIILNEVYIKLPICLSISLSTYSSIPRFLYWYWHFSLKYRSMRTNETFYIFECLLHNINEIQKNIHHSYSKNLTIVVKYMIPCLALSNFIPEIILGLHYFYLLLRVFNVFKSILMYLIASKFIPYNIIAQLPTSIDIKLHLDSIQYILDRSYFKYFCM